jgi:hypothetical protein
MPPAGVTGPRPLHDQRFFFCPAESLDRTFADKRFGPASAGFAVHHVHRPSRPRETRSRPVIVLGEPFFKVFSDARVQRTVAAFEEVKEPHFLGASSTVFLLAHLLNHAPIFRVHESLRATFLLSEALLRSEWGKFHCWVFLFLI